MLAHDRVAVGIDAEGVVVGFFREDRLDVVLGLFDDICLRPDCVKVNVRGSGVCVGLRWDVGSVS